MTDDRLAALLQSRSSRNEATGCLEWVYAKTARGYGHQFWMGKMRYTHRLSWEVHNGPIPRGMCICHRCDNPSCIEPTHLFCGTQADNLRDARAKGRMPAYNGCNDGERSHSAVLDEAAVVQIIRQVRLGTTTQAEVGARYGVRQCTVSAIMTGRTWKRSRSVADEPARAG